MLAQQEEGVRPKDHQIKNTFFMLEKCKIVVLQRQAQINFGTVGEGTEILKLVLGGSVRGTETSNSFTGRREYCTSFSSLQPTLERTVNRSSRGSAPQWAVEERKDIFYNSVNADISLMLEPVNSQVGAIHLLQDRHQIQVHFTNLIHMKMSHADIDTIAKFVHVPESPIDASDPEVNKRNGPDPQASGVFAIASVKGFKLTLVSDKSIHSVPLIQFQSLNTVIKFEKRS